MGSSMLRPYPRLPHLKSLTPYMVRVFLLVRINTGIILFSAYEMTPNRRCTDERRTVFSVHRYTTWRRCLFLCSRTYRCTHTIHRYLLCKLAIACKKPVPSYNTNTFKKLAPPLRPKKKTRETSCIHLRKNMIIHWNLCAKLSAAVARVQNHNLYGGGRCIFPFFSMKII